MDTESVSMSFATCVGSFKFAPAFEFLWGGMGLNWHISLTSPLTTPSQMQLFTCHLHVNDQGRLSQPGCVWLTSHWLDSVSSYKARNTKAGDSVLWWNLSGPESSSPLCILWRLFIRQSTIQRVEGVLPSVWTCLACLVTLCKMTTRTY